jgi:hypothetical protein
MWPILSQGADSDPRTGFSHSFDIPDDVQHEAFRLVRLREQVGKMTNGVGIQAMREGIAPIRLTAVR